jgi:hypothetical protein
VVDVIEHLFGLALHSFRDSFDVGDSMKAFAMLTAVVLLTIGIGVGILAATEGPLSYGPPDGQFTVAFSAQPPSIVECPSQALRKCPLGFTQVFYYAARTKDGLLAEVQVFLGGHKLSVLVDRTRTTLSHVLHYDVHSFYQGVNLIAFRGLQCSEPVRGLGINNFFSYPCSGIQLESDHRTVWEIRVAGRNLTEVKAFLASFHPLN